MRIRAAASGTLVLGLLVLLAGCDSDSPVDRPSGRPSSSSTDDQAGASPSAAVEFPTTAFADIPENPVSVELASELQAALSDIRDKGPGGVTATVMSSDGTWSGATGRANLTRDLGVNDQFNIGSISKAVVAAQVMQLVEKGALELDDPAADHLPSHLDFDTNGATIRNLLGMRSGIPDYWAPEFERSLTDDPLRVWTTEEVLESIPAWRTPAGGGFQYSSTNYVLLGLVIEEVAGRPLVDVFRDGVLDVHGTGRLISQPHERPTAPMAMPFGGSTSALKKGGGYLPSVASVTSNGPGAVMASDAPSLARWWRAFCAGEVVSRDSLIDMTTFEEGYGMGVFSLYGQAVGHTGADVGYVAWAGCLPDTGTVIVVLRNQVVDDIGAMAAPLVDAASTGPQ